MYVVAGSDSLVVVVGLAQDVEPVGVAEVVVVVVVTAGEWA